MIRIVLIGLFVSFPLLAVESNLGIGIVTHSNLPAFSGKFPFNEDYSFSTIIGFDTKPAASSFVLGGKVFRHAFQRKNSHFFLDLGLFLLSPPNGSTGYEVNAGVGSEFFLPQIDNIGFTFEVGLALSYVGEAILKTYGGSFVSAGIHYYF